MKRLVIALAMSLCTVSLTSIASADTLVMRDGARFEGTALGHQAVDFQATLDGQESLRAPQTEPAVANTRLVGSVSLHATFS